MEGISLAVACLTCGMAGYFAADLILRVSFSPTLRAKRSHGIGVRRKVFEVLEYIGSWPPMVRLSNWQPARRCGARLRGALAGRGIVLSEHACVATMAVVLGASIALCMLISLSTLGAVVGAAGVACAYAALVGRHERRERARATSQMPEVFRSLASALGAGKSLPQSIEYVGAHLGDPLGSEFLRASFELKGGASTIDAVEGLCRRVDVPGMDLLGTSLQISQRTGSSLDGLFARTANMVSDGVALRRQLQVKTTQVRLSARVVAGIPVALVGILTLVSPEYRAGIACPAGRACLCVAALLDIVALAAVRATMKRSLL